GRDLYENRLVRWIDRLYLAWVVLTFGLPFMLGYAIGGTAMAGLEGLVWGGLIRVFLYQHATFSVNSICHMFGRKEYRSRDEARNNWLVARAVVLAPEHVADRVHAERRVLRSEEHTAELQSR